MLARFRALYGDSPGHLVGLIASMLIAAAGVVGWFDGFATSDIVRILVWFGAAIVAHDLILLPLYSLLDHLGHGRSRTGSELAPREHSHGWVYLRVPALLSGLLFLVFFPEILRLGDQTFNTASGLHQNVYLARYLGTCGALFALSALAYAAGLGRARQAGSTNERVDLALVHDPQRGAGGTKAEAGLEPYRGGHEGQDEVDPQPDHGGP